MNASKRLRSGDEGFTLIEMVITVAMVGLIMVALTGVVISYLKTTVSTSARLTESHDVQFAAVYWSRDVASIGVRSATYDNGSAHTFPLLQSVSVAPDTGVSSGCGLPSGATKVVTLAGSQYTSLDSSQTPTTVTVTYATEGSSAPYTLIRRRCVGGATDSTITVADNLTSVPTVGCPDTSTPPNYTAAKCNTSGSSVPDVVRMVLTSSDPNNNDGTTYSAALTGERRES
ncbi:prepilin-type N-terminal cleavage/methylation domain-containing protein [Nocardioides ultimimeridianus]